MSGTSGVQTWDTRPFRSGALIRVGGVALTYQSATGGTTWQLGSATGELVMEGGNIVTQCRIQGGDVPLGIASHTCGFEAQAEDEEEFFLLDRLRRLGVAVPVWLADVSEDVWCIAAANTGQTEYRTIWPMAYDGTNVTHATNPPKAFLSSTLMGPGTAQTIITSGTPTSGQVKVLTSASGDPVDVVTVPSGLSGSFLSLRYAAAPRCRIVSASRTFAAPGDYRYAVQLRALPMGGGYYTPLASS